MNVDLELIRLNESLMKRLALISKNHEENAEELQAYCLKKSDDKVDKYVNCIKAIKNKVDADGRLLTIKTEFEVRKVKECFDKNPQDFKTMMACKEEALKNTDSYIKSYYNTLESYSAK